MKWSHLHCHSHYSLLDAISKPDEIIQKCAEYGYHACAITDHGSISGAVKFMKSAKKAGIKPIIGCEFYITEHNIDSVENKDNKLLHILVYARNLKGFSKLCKLVSMSYGMFYRKPRIDHETLFEIASDDLIIATGHYGSSLQGVYDEQGFDAAVKLIEQYKEVFGKDNVFLEVQSVIDSFEQDVLKNAVRELGKTTNTPVIAVGDSHYTSKEDVDDHRVMLCSGVRTTMKKALKEKSGFLSTFMGDNRFYIFTPEELTQLYTEEEILNTNLLADMCEDYDLFGKPKLPRAFTPDGKTEEEYLKELCNAGWKKLPKDLRGCDEYKNRIRYEVDVLSNAGLSGYFLIVQDYVNWAKSRGWLVGPGRGSAGGCLLSYILGITVIDPIQHNLLFSRFYNAGRNTGDKVSLPDIDVDFPVSVRENVIEYIRNKYGQENVGQIVTFGRLQGRGALREVMRIHDNVSFMEINEVCKIIPHESEISDQLADNQTVLQWALENMSDELKDYCYIDSNGELSGNFSPYFEQAIRLEGVVKTQGKHAAGVIISPERLDTNCPIIRAKDSGPIIGFEMDDLEDMGYVKFDILGLRTLDCLSDALSLILQRNSYGRNVSD